MKRLFHLTMLSVVCAAAISAEIIREPLGDTGLSIQIPSRFKPPVASSGGHQPSLFYSYVDSNGATHIFPTLRIDAYPIYGDNWLNEYIAMLTERSEVILGPQPRTIANFPVIEFAVANIVMTPDSVPTQRRVIKHMFLFENQGQGYACYLETNSHEHDEYTSELNEFCNSILIAPNKAAQLDGSAATGLNR